MNKQQAIELVRKTFESRFDRDKYVYFLRELLNGFDDEGARINQGTRIPEKFQDYVEKMERVGKYTVDKSEIMLFIVTLKKKTSIERARTKQRNFVAHYLEMGGKAAALVAFVSPNSVDWRFSLVKMEYGFKERPDGTPKAVTEFTPARRWSFLVGANEKSHTAQSRLVDLVANDEHNPTLAQLADAFNVEPVTAEFFKVYREIFEEAEATIKLKWTEEKKRLYTQRFFNRVMFLAFLERKGWLTFGGRKDYLRALIEDYLAGEREKNANFHRSRLNTLFFWGLNNPRGDERNSPKFQELKRRIGEVPYLNGGLFDQEVDDEEHFFPDVVVAKVLSELVYQFNFTVTESTPLDVEVAVDPEILGRIFEELVTGRHESGSYYTPKPVVAFMCREALKGYLGTAIPSESQEALASFVDKNDASALKNPEQALNALRAVKVCDPACGSGAYLLGMLHELLEQRECLFVASKLDAKTIYDRKLEIIQNNLYGVDKDDFAVNIARLRLWLSLVVDDTRNPLEDPSVDVALPNLDFKIEAGDSLTAPDPSGGLNLSFRSQLVDDFLLAKNQYTTSHYSEKRALKEQINKLRDDIKAWSGRDAIFNGFDWTIEFAEIFIKPAPTTTLKGAMAGLVNTASGQLELAATPPAKTGFDIILANPPYVRADAQFKHIEDEKERQKQIAEWQTFRKQLKDSKIYKTLHEKWDLFIPFLERAYQLLRQNGQMIFIIPDAYNAAKYTSKSHEFFLQSTRIERIDFCSEINLFDAGVNNTILHIAKTLPDNSHQPIRVRRWGNRDEFENNIEVLPTNTQAEFSEPLFKTDGTINQHSDKYLPLEQVVYVSYGLRANADDSEWLGEFKTEDCVSPKKDKTHPKPFIQGKDITKWAKRRVWYLEWGTERAPDKFSRPTFIELQQAKPKLLAMKNSGAEPVAIYDEEMTFFDATIIGFVPWHILENVVNKSINKTAKYKHQDPLGDREAREVVSREFQIKYLLALLNSTFTKSWIDKKRRHKVSIYPDDWKQLPVAPISLEEQKEIAKLVDKILGEYEKHGYPLPETSAEKVREWEGQLDEMVSRLYEEAREEK